MGDYEEYESIAELYGEELNKRILRCFLKYSSKPIEVDIPIKCGGLKKIRIDQVFRLPLSKRGYRMRRLFLYRIEISNMYGLFHGIHDKKSVAHSSLRRNFYYDRNVLKLVADYEKSYKYVYVDESQITKRHTPDKRTIRFTTKSPILSICFSDNNQLHMFTEKSIVRIRDYVEEVPYSYMEKNMIIDVEPDHRRFYRSVFMAFSEAIYRYREYNRSFRGIDTATRTQTDFEEC